MVIGVDGGTWTALKPYIDQGVMPRLGRIIEEGAHGTLRSVIPPITAPAWASFATGVNPGRHGCYYFLTMRSFGDFRPISSEDIKVETFYETLVAGGRRCTLVNLPVSYPAMIDGTVITSLMSMGDDIIHPPGLVDEIPLLKEYEIIPAGVFPPHKTEFPHDSDLFIRNDTVRFQVAKELFGREWEFFFVLFGGSDGISHRAFAEMLSGEGPKGRGAREYFEKLDGWIGWFFENAEPGTLKMIVSDHGFKVRRGDLAVNSWLEQNGFLKFKPGEPGEGKVLPFLHTPARAGSLKPSVGRIRDAVAGNRLTSRFMPIIKRMFERPGRVRRMVASDFILDLEASTAICAHDGVFVREDTEDREKIVDELVKGLNELGSHYGVFAQAARREDIYWGPAVDMAPDITLIDSNFTPNNARREEVFIERRFPGHDKDGIWVLSGPDGIAGKELNASLMDICPTLMDWMDVEPAHRFDGTSLLSRLGIK